MCFNIRWIQRAQLHIPLRPYHIVFFFFLNDTAPTEIYTLSLHDALPIAGPTLSPRSQAERQSRIVTAKRAGDRKSTRLNSSHVSISYAVVCLKKKKLVTNHCPLYNKIKTKSKLTKVH